ncbi:MAG: hypothetical protein ACI85I_001574 [Arenicella sp.]|jgi:hypothetical protein
MYWLKELVIISILVVFCQNDVIVHKRDCNGYLFCVFTQKSSLYVNGKCLQTLKYMILLRMGKYGKKNILFQTIIVRV